MEGQLTTQNFLNVPRKVIPQGTFLFQGSSDEIGKSWRQKILSQPKVLKAEEYCMYFPLSELRGWGKRFAAQPKTI